MFEQLRSPQPDGIIRLMQMFRDDPRDQKVDLGVGVYRDESGHTPVMRAVKAAEAQLVESQDTKGYVALAGDPGFHQAMGRLLLGGAVPEDRLAFAATPGGTGAVRQILELIRLARPDATVWISAPTWPNHPALIGAVGLRQAEYRYLDAESGAVDLEGMLADLGRVAEGDVVLLHGCCHNPSGADLRIQEWAELAALLERRGAVPFIDMAYQGFGEGIEADAAGLRHLAARLPEVLVAASCSKNFGVYRDRVGLALAICAPETRNATAAAMAWLNRQNFAFPPDHGARVVSMILGDPRLEADWREELDSMRLRMAANRVALAEALRAETGSDRFGFLASHRGMFSILGIDEAAVTRLRDDHGVYVVGDGRINIAGLNQSGIPIVARAIAEVSR